MNPETEKWVSKAEGDFHTARRELRARKAPNYDDACFHAQQGAEKYLKSVLVEARLPFSKTHDLLLLLESCLPAAPMGRLKVRLAPGPVLHCPRLLERMKDEG